MNIASLGEARFPSPVAHIVSDQARIPAVIVRDPDALKRDEVLFELAGPRAKLFFDPAKTRAGHAILRPKLSDSKQRRQCRRFGPL